MGFSRREYWRGSPCPPPGDLPNPWIAPRSPALQADSLLSEPPGKPMNTGVGSLSLLQGIFPTQESNQGLLHCRQILYQLSYQGSPGLSISDSTWGLGFLFKKQQLVNWQSVKKLSVPGGFLLKICMPYSYPFALILCVSLWVFLFKFYLFMAVLSESSSLHLGFL